MGNIRLYGSTSGYTELAPPAVAPDGVLSLPSGTGTIAKTTDQGLVLISPTSIANSGGTATASGGQVTFTTVNSVSVNGVFSDTYDNYRIVISALASTGIDLRMRHRAAGSDDSASNYYNRANELGATYVSNGGSATNNILGTLRTNRSLFTGDFGGIRSTGYKTFTGFMQDSSGTTVLRANTGQNNNAATFDGLTLYTDSGTFTGIIRVYGYKNS